MDEYALETSVDNFSLTGLLNLFGSITLVLPKESNK